MGNCVLVQKSTDPATQIGLQLEPPTKERTLQVADPGLDHKLSSSGEDLEGTSPESSKAVMFFDSQAWFDSDTEDFLSVNDFTPSRGNTPIHPKSFMEKQPQTEMNKQLFELFCESLRYDTSSAREKEDVSKGINFPDTFTTTTPCTSIPYPICSNEATPNGGGYQPKKDKSSQSAQCCFPGFVRSLSFRERKKRPSAVESGAW